MSSLSLVTFAAIFLTAFQQLFAYGTPIDHHRSAKSVLSDSNARDTNMYVCPSLIPGALAPTHSIQKNVRNTSYFNEDVAPNLKCLLPPRSALVIPLLSSSYSSFFSYYYYVVKVVSRLISVESPLSSLEIDNNIFTRSQVSPLRSFEDYGITFPVQRIQQHQDNKIQHNPPEVNNTTIHIMSRDGHLAASEAKRWIEDYEDGLVGERMTEMDKTIISYLRTKAANRHHSARDEEDIEKIISEGAGTSDAGGVFSLLFGVTQRYATAIIHAFSSFSSFSSSVVSYWDQLYIIPTYIMSRFPTTTQDFWNTIKGVFTTIFHHFPQYLFRVFNVMIFDPTALVTRVVTRIEYQIGESTASFADTAAMSAAARLRSVRVFWVNPRKYISYYYPVDANVNKNNVTGEDILYEGKENHGETSSDENVYIHRRNLMKNGDNENIEDKSLIDAIVASDAENSPISCDAWETPHNDENRDDDEIFLSDMRGPRRQQNKRALETYHNTGDLLGRKEYPSDEVISNLAKKNKLKRVQQFIRRKIEGSVQEVCLTHITSWIPPWLQALLNPTGIESRVRFRKPIVRTPSSYPSSSGKKSPSQRDINIQKGDTSNNDKDQNKGPEPPTYDIDIKTPTYYTCDLGAPKVALGCLRIEAFYDNKDVEVSVFQVNAWDIKWAYLMLSLFIITIAKPSLVSNRLLQLLSSAALGILFIVLLLAYFVFNELKKTNVGKVSIVVLFSSGGLLALSETVTNMIWFYLTKEIWVNPAVQVAVGGSALISALLSNFVFFARVPMMTNAVLTVMQVGIVIVAVAHNREASVSLFIMFIFFMICRERRRRNSISDESSSSGGLIWVLLNVIMTMIFFGPISMIIIPVRFLRWIIMLFLQVLGLAKNITSVYDSDNTYPRDYYTHDDITPQSYCTPAVSQSSVIRGATRQDKFDAYDKQGSEHTRKALRDLMDHVHQNPEKYIMRVQDPGALGRFANLNDI